MKKIVIAGGGISGLTARYYLSKRYPTAEITLYEKSNRLGGCVESSQKPFFFERGPRTFKASRSEALLELIEGVGLSDQMIYSSKCANRRYLWKDGKLQRLHLFSPLMRPVIPFLLKEWRQPYPWEGDETIASFATRRFGKYAAETFFDPLALGIFAGDIHKLSISTCFPELKEMEMHYGSITKAFFKKKRKKKKRGLFTLRGGLQTLIDRLVEKGEGEIHLNTPLKSLDEEELILAVSAPAAKRLFEGDAKAQEFFNQIETANLTVVNVGFKENFLKYKGFGYLVPSSEKEKVLGVVFDSSIFPEQSRSGETRLTVMLKEGGVETALEGLHRHLGIQNDPTEVHIKEYASIIPQYGVGHLERVKAFEKHLNEKYSHITCVGNYFRGASINACVNQSRSRFKI